MYRSGYDIARMKKHSSCIQSISYDTVIEIDTILLGVQFLIADFWLDESDAYIYPET